MLITTHRRESWGQPLHRIGTAIAQLARAEPDTPRPLIAGAPNVIITEPLDYADFFHAMRDAHLNLTDSGVQEEAPASAEAACSG